MPQLPHDRLPDSTLAFVRDGYEFVSNRCRRYRSDVFETRLLFNRVICMRGGEAARVFYSDRFQRRGATPSLVRKTVFGEGAIQSLDADAHRHRKQMFMSLVGDAAIEDLADRFASRWRAAVAAWSQRDEVVLYDEAARLLCQAVCDWAGVPLPEEQVGMRTDDLVALFDPAPPLRVPYWRALRARDRTEGWIAELVQRIRRGELRLPEGRALHVVATHRDLSGRLLPPRIAAVEVINVLRPTVAITHFIVFVALALHEHPDWRERLVAGRDEEREWFAQEVRRYYPFVPPAAARVRRDFEWNGARFPRGRLVLLDLYGTNRHPNLWDEPDQFRPERFATWDGDPYTLIPQGGGDHHTGHRCPGEWITIRLMSTAIALLTRKTSYRVPHQDLYVSMSRMPARPRSGFVLRDAQPTEVGV